MYRQILIIAPELDICKKLKYELSNGTINAYYVTSFDSGMRYVVYYECQLIIMDASFPKNVWLQFLKEIREIKSLPILILSDSGESSDIVEALSVADDYLQKPFDLEVCRAKVNALLRRPVSADQGPPCALSKDGNLIVIPHNRIVRLAHSEIPLPRIPFDLLYLLVSNEGRVLTREQLYQNVWGEEFNGAENTLNCQISFLRQTLKDACGTANYIQTIRGVGYRFDSKAG